MSVRVVGVRHHSPACARLVEYVLRKEKPKTVLIEGPSDFNQRIDELLLDHNLPLAIFSYYHEGCGTHSCWSPFCDYSPEWVALRVGRQIGAELRFMDLPAWTRPMRGVENRYADGGDSHRDYVGELCQRLNIEGMDALWDHLFEQVECMEELSKRLDSYFEALRGCDQVETRDKEREEFMATHLAWAAAQSSRVVAICGGYHKPYLEQRWQQLVPTQPELPMPEGRHGSFLVPYSFHRLDSFTGYAAGMPSPAYYQSLWELGASQTGEVMTREVAQRLRARKQHVSAADLIAANSMTEGLMRLRGHPQPSRTDLLDGFASALVKEAIEQPLPWTGRGVLESTTHPMLVELVATFSGQRKGELDPETPLPPLVGQVRALLQTHDLLPTRPARKVTCAVDSSRSHLLHQLRVLEIPGFSFSAEKDDFEHWALLATDEFDSSLIEAGAWGATLTQAAQARLLERVEMAQGAMDKVAEVLLQADLAGLTELSQALLDALKRQVGLEGSFARLGRAHSVVLRLYRRARQSSRGELLRTFCERSMWLFEGISGEQLPADPAVISAVVALRDTYRLAPELNLAESEPRAVMTRRASDPEAPPTVRGAAIGFLWSTTQEAVSLEEQSLEAVRASSRPAELGDFLAGLFGLAREEAVSRAELMKTIDTVVCSFPEDDFLVACPSLRLAFSYFPPRERAKVARLVLGLHGGDPVDAWSMLRLETSSEAILEHSGLEREVDEVMERFGLTWNH